MKSTDTPDRRRYQRHKAREGSFAALQPSYAVGEITNISRGGLAVQYALYDRDSETPSEVTIFSSTDHFYLKRIPCKAVSDSEIEASLPFSPMSVRRCGLQFGDLTEEQQSQLDHFLKNYTAGSA